MNIFQDKKLLLISALGLGIVIYFLYPSSESSEQLKPLEKKSNPFGAPSKYVVKDTTGKILFDKKSFKSVYHAWDYIHKHHPNEDENNYRVTMKGIK